MAPRVVAIVGWGPFFFSFICACVCAAHMACVSRDSYYLGRAALLAQPAVGTVCVCVRVCVCGFVFTGGQTQHRSPGGDRASSAPENTHVARVVAAAVAAAADPATGDGVTLGWWRRCCRRRCRGWRGHHSILPRRCGARQQSLAAAGQRARVCPRLFPIGGWQRISLRRLSRRAHRHHHCHRHHRCGFLHPRRDGGGDGDDGDDGAARPPTNGSLRADPAAGVP